MGEIAEMMLDGTICEQCGEYIGDGDGYPRNCGCDNPSGFQIEPLFHGNKVSNKVACPECNKRVKEVGLADHMRDKHGSKP